MGATVYQWNEMGNSKNNLYTLDDYRENKEKSPRKGGKAKGQKSEVYPYQTEDLRKIINYFADNNNWIHYLAIAFGVNTARRISDILTLKWGNIFTESGNFRSEITIVEKKTGKFGTPAINEALKGAINLYLEKTGVDPAENGWQNDVFVQPSGTYKGRRLTQSGHQKALKKAAAVCGIEYNVGTHSARKTFGAVSRNLHPHDYDSMEILQSVYNHSSTKTTKRYIGLTKKNVDQYHEDFGDYFTKYVIGGEEIPLEMKKPVVSVEFSDLREIFDMIYKAGMSNSTGDLEQYASDMLTALEITESISK